MCRQANKVRSMAKGPNVFHRAVFGRLNFYVTISTDGPYIGCEEDASGVAIGRCTAIEKFENPYADSGFTYAICKYHNQVRTTLNGLSEEDVRRFSEEFGIPVSGMTSSDSDKVFRSSEAFKSLVSWAMAHPRLFAQCRRQQNYLAWSEMVDAELQQTE